MKIFAISVCLLSTSALASQETSERVTLSTSSVASKLTLVSSTQLELTLTPFESPPLRLTMDRGLSFQELPALHAGSGASAETRQILALLLGLVLGFGTGHLVARDRDGFVLFLVVDLAIILVGSVVSYFLWYGPFVFLGLLASHIIQGLDAYAEAGGERIIQRTRERALPVASAASGHQPLITSRLLAIPF